MGDNKKLDWFGDRVLLGSFHDMIDPTLMEYSGMAGFDFVVIEWEHGLRNEETVQHMIRAANSVGVAPLVRIGLLDQRLTEQTLDAGAVGVLFARIDSAADARQAVAFCRYPPSGTRGTGFRRGRFMDYSEEEMVRMRQESDDVAVFAIIETRAGVENIEEILDVEGLTGILLGPADLGLDMGGLQMTHPDVTASILKVRDATASRADRCLLVASADPEHARAQVDAGAGAIMVFHDSYLVGNLYKDLHAQLSTALER